MRKGEPMRQMTVQSAADAHGFPEHGFPETGTIVRLLLQRHGGLRILRYVVSELLCHTFSN